MGFFKRYGSLFAVMVFAFHAFADVVDYKVSILDEGRGVDSTVNIPTFNPALGTLQSVEVAASFAGKLTYSEGEVNGQLNYSVSLGPLLLLDGYPFTGYVDLSGDISESGTLNLQNGFAFVDFAGNGGDQTFGPILVGPPAEVTVNDLFLTNSGPLSPSVGWSLYYDITTLDIRYDYTPEPVMLLPIALVLLAIICVKRRTVAKFAEISPHGNPE